MSDSAIGNGCLHHYDNAHIQVRRDFYRLCAYDKSHFGQKLTRNGKKVKDEPNQECMAKIIRILETLTDHEKTSWLLKAQKIRDQGLNPPQEPKTFPIQLSYSAFCSLLYETYGDSTVRNSVACLVSFGFIKQDQRTANSIPFYTLNIRVLQQALKDQAERDLSGVEFDTQDQASNSTAKPSGVEFDSQETAVDSQETAVDSQETAVDTNNIYIRKNKKTHNKEDSVPPTSPPQPSLEEVSSSETHTLFPEEEKPAETKPTPHSEEEMPAPKPRKPKTDPDTTTEKPAKVTREQIKKAYEVISKVKAELYTDPEYIEVENERSTKAIIELVKAKGTPTLLALVLKDMWNERGDDGTYWWRQNRKRMSVSAICSQYANRASDIKQKMARQQPAQQTTTTQTPTVSSVPGIGDNSCRPELKRYVPDMPLPTTQWRNPNKRTPRFAIAQGGDC